MFLKIISSYFLKINIVSASLRGSRKGLGTGWRSIIRWRHEISRQIGNGEGKAWVLGWSGLLGEKGVWGRKRAIGPTHHNSVSVHKPEVL